MSGGLFALLDDIATLTKMSAAHVRPLADAAVSTSLKTTGVVVDDAAVAPQFVEGIKPSRELPVIGRIALGSAINKILIILPAALLLSQFAPWVLTPLLMIGGSYLCFEGAEKVWHWLRPGSDGAAGAASPVPPPAALRGPEAERAMVRQAVTTDFILSTEIMVISLSEVAGQAFWDRFTTLVIVALILTALVYGVVAVIVKMDDVGVLMYRRGRTPAGRACGGFLLWGMPRLLTLLSVVGTFAMLWVGGHILLKGTSDMGWPVAYHGVEHLAGLVAQATGFLGPVLGWLTETGFSLLTGLVWGAFLLACWTGIARLVRGGSA